MDERLEYYVIDIWFPKVTDNDDYFKQALELCKHLRNNGYDFYYTCHPGNSCTDVIIINKEQTGYIDTILQDRNIKYEYVTV